ncbi:MAG: YkvA family protein [Heliobacteriaceae bacterium]|nr:YkvA family protein [Heliobacteriaceae bacterium]MDD4587903.1 YkvA family protein [Heliobacteriaceae bacterium]
MPPGYSPNFWQRLRILFNLPRSTRLIYSLLKDSRVPGLNKVLLLGLGTAYFLMPVDVVPDFLPFFGQFDDLTVMLFLVDRFVASAPGHVVQEHLHTIR